ncbi:MAG: peptidyl-tRNA hydrolase Pth2 [Candidatus Diapherotrites archaeon]|uniref:Peptidyl-tRNA hydrolase n=1 Tax=Candidatus Iainarchaeum sp. TaxID=3101447 RepID=A0A8T4L420_9ARCH|nr:peptidyl-tRNA hydrolase Pth2 [Candidatus Diapherotrites archaeon]
MGSFEYKQAIIVRNDLKMGKGKIAAQSAHAALEAVEKARAKYPEWLAAWKTQGQAKIVLKVDSETEIVELFENAKRELPSALIHDAGHTQVTPGSITAIAIGPGPSDKIDRYTKKLKLL